MRLERDNIPLDKDFPFQISEVVLTPKNSRPGPGTGTVTLRSPVCLREGELFCQWTGVYDGEG